MTIFPAVGSVRPDLLSNGSGQRPGEIGRHGGGVLPRFPGAEAGIDANAGGEPCVPGAAWSGTRGAPGKR